MNSCGIIKKVKNTQRESSIESNTRIHTPIDTLRSGKHIFNGGSPDVPQTSMQACYIHSQPYMHEYPDESVWQLHRDADNRRYRFKVDRCSNTDTVACADVVNMSKRSKLKVDIDSFMHRFDKKAKLISNKYSSLKREIGIRKAELDKAVSTDNRKVEQKYLYNAIHNIAINDNRIESSINHSLTGYRPLDQASLTTKIRRSVSHSISKPINGIQKIANKNPDNYVQVGDVIINFDRSSSKRSNNEILSSKQGNRHQSQRLYIRPSDTAAFISSPILTADLSMSAVKLKMTHTRDLSSSRQSNSRLLQNSMVDIEKSKHRQTQFRLEVRNGIMASPISMRRKIRVKDMPMKTDRLNMILG